MSHSRVHLECKVWVGESRKRGPVLVLGCEVVDPDVFGDPVIVKRNVPKDAPRSTNPGDVTCRACRRSTAMWRIRNGAWRSEVDDGWRSSMQTKRAVRRMLNRGHRKHAWKMANAKRRGIPLADKPEAAIATPVDMHRTRPVRPAVCSCARCQRKFMKKIATDARKEEGKC